MIISKSFSNYNPLYKLWFREGVGEEISAEAESCLSVQYHLNFGIVERIGKFISVSILTIVLIPRAITQWGGKRSVAAITIIWPWMDFGAEGYLFLSDEGGWRRFSLI